MSEDENNDFYIRPLSSNDRNWVAHFLDEHWGSTKIVSRGEVYYGHLLPGFVAVTGQAPDSEEGGSAPNSETDGEPIGLLTYRIDQSECEIMTLDTLIHDRGVGTALLDALKHVASEEKLKRIWLVTTNDNLNALKFYQKRDFQLIAVYADALSEARKIKPQIPLIGRDGIPLRDEIELAYTV